MFAFPKFSSASTAPVVGEMMRVALFAVTDDTAPPPPLIQFPWNA